MNDYQKYINALRKCAKEHDNDRTPTFHIIVSDLCRDTANLLEALEQEPRTGHWKPYLKEGLRYQCSACDSRFDTPWEYCPNCGAKMVESQESEE